MSYFGTTANAVNLIASAMYLWDKVPNKQPQADLGQVGQGENMSQYLTNGGYPYPMGFTSTENGEIAVTPVTPPAPSFWDKVGNWLKGAAGGLVPAPKNPAGTVYGAPPPSTGISTNTIILIGAAVVGVYLVTKKSGAKKNPGSARRRVRRARRRVRACR